MTLQPDRRTFLGGALGAVGALAVGRLAGEEKGPDAASWPQFKGNAARTGDNPDAALKLPLNRVLAVRFPAPIYASPAVDGDLVYVQDADSHLACIHAKQRRIIWSTRLDVCTNNTSSPALLGHVIVIGTTKGRIHFLVRDGGGTTGGIEVDGPVAAAPVVTSDAIYCSTLNGKLYKLRMGGPIKGEIVWSFDGGKTSITELAVRGDQIAFFAGTSTPFHYLIRDKGKTFEVLQKRVCSEQTCPTSGPVFVSDDDCAYQCFDSEFGTFFLNDRILAIDVQDTRGVPSVRGKRLYRGDKCWDLDAIDTDKLKKHPQQGGTLATPIWRADPQALYDGGFHSSPALAKDHLVIGSELGRLHFFDLAGGDKIKKPAWSFETTRAGKPNGGISSSPAVVNGRVYFGGEDGILYGLGDGPETEIIDLPRQRTPAQFDRLPGNEWPTAGGDMGFSFVAPASKHKPPYQIKWRTRLWSTFKCPMIVAAGKVFCGGRSGLLACLDARDGAILWKTHHPGVESRSAPTYADGKLFILRARCGQGDSPHVLGASGGPPGEGLWCHSSLSGDAIWHRAMPVAYHFNVDGLCVIGNRVLCCETDADGQVHALALDVVDGKEAWRTKLDGIVTGKNRPLRFSGVLAQGVWCLGVAAWKRTGITCGFDPANGKLLWRKDDIGLEVRSRLGARKDLVVAFDKKGGHALDPKTGEELWVGLGRDSTGSDTYAMQPLTDAFLESKGQQTVIVRGCANPIYLNGLVYSHDTRSAYSSNWLIVKDGGKIVWEQPFLSNACPTPSPAYEALYYAPNAEGVIYCFK